MSSTWDPRFGPGWPNCDANYGRVNVKLDFGLGSVFTVEYQSGAVVPLLKAVFRVKAHNELGKDTYKVRIAGTFACRPMRTANKASLHSLPLAIDINPDTNAPNASRHDIPPWFVECFRHEGFTWGGDWLDYMHLENPNWYGEWDGSYPEEEEMTKEERDALARMQLFWSGVDHFRNGKAPRKDAPYAVKLGYRTAQDAAKEE